MQPVNFTVTNNLTSDNEYNVLVFLTPIGDKQAENFYYSAWQQLKPPAGGSSGFEFVDTMGLNVATENANGQVENRSRLYSVDAGQYWKATLAAGGGPIATLDPNTIPTPATSVNVINDATQGVNMSTLWQINGNEVLRQGGLNKETVASFELFPALFFMVAIPTETGFNWKFQQFSSTKWKYYVPQGTTDVKVTWSRPTGPNGADELTFDPPSGPSPTGA